MGVLLLALLFGLGGLTGLFLTCSSGHDGKERRKSTPVGGTRQRRNKHGDDFEDVYDDEDISDHDKRPRGDTKKKKKKKKKGDRVPTEEPNDILM